MSKAPTSPPPRSRKPKPPAAPPPPAAAPDLEAATREELVRVLADEARRRRESRVLVGLVTIHLLAVVGDCAGAWLR